MKLRNVIVYLIIFVCAVLNVGNDFDEYEKLKNRNVPLIKKEDLPVEFSQKHMMLLLISFKRLVF